MDCKNKTPEEIIRELVLQNRGTQNYLQKQDLLRMADERGISVSDKGMKKPALYELLLTAYSPAEIAERGGVGLGVYHFRVKLGLSSKELREMAKDGLVHEMGKEAFRIGGHTRYAPLYSVYDYYRLTPEDVEQWRACSKARRPGRQKNVARTQEEG